MLYISGLHGKSIKFSIAPSLVFCTKKRVQLCYQLKHILKFSGILLNKHYYHFTNSSLRFFIFFAILTTFLHLAV